MVAMLDNDTNDTNDTTDMRSNFSKNSRHIPEIKTKQMNQIIENRNNLEKVKGFGEIKFDNKEERPLDRSRGKTILTKYTNRLEDTINLPLHQNKLYPFTSQRDVPWDNNQGNNQIRNLSNTSNNERSQRNMELFTGSLKSTYKNKKETESFAGPALLANTVTKDNDGKMRSYSFASQIKNRVIPSNKNNSADLPFESNIKVKPGLENNSQDGISQVYKIDPLNIDNLRSKANQKQTYKSRIAGPALGIGKRGKKGDLTKKKIPTFIVNDKPVKGKSAVDAMKVNGKIEESKNIRDLHEFNYKKPGINATMGEGPNMKNKTFIEPLKNEDVYLVDRPNNVSGRKKTLQNIDSYQLLVPFNNRVINGTVDNEGRNINISSSKYSFDYESNKPQITIKDTTAENTNGPNGIKFTSEVYVNNNTDLDPTIRNTTNHNITGNPNRVNKETYMNNTLVLDPTIRNTTNHNITGNPNRVNKETYMNNNLLLDPTIRNTTNHNITGNPNQVNKETYMNNNTKLDPTIRNLTNHNIIGNPSKLSKETYMNTNTKLDPTMRNLTNHSINGNPSKLSKETYLNTNTKLDPTMRNIINHNIIGNPNQVSKETYVNTNTKLDPTMRNITNHSISGNPNQVSKETYVNTNTNLDPTMRNLTNHSISGNPSKLSKETYVNTNTKLDPTMRNLTNHSIVGNVTRVDHNAKRLRSKDLKLQTTNRDITSDKQIEQIGNVNNDVKHGYVKSNNLKAKPTIKQTTIYENYHGQPMLDSRDKYIRSKDEDLRYTQKEDTLLEDYLGVSEANVKGTISKISTDNMTTDGKRESVAAIAGKTTLKNGSTNIRNYDTQVELKEQNIINYVGAPFHSQGYIPNNDREDNICDNTVNRINCDDNTITGDYSVNKNFITSLGENPFNLDINNHILKFNPPSER